LQRRGDDERLEACFQAGGIVLVALCIGACSGETADGKAACSGTDCAGNEGSASATNGAGAASAIRSLPTKRR
jgi:hypothetical protein